LCVYREERGNGLCGLSIPPRHCSSLDHCYLRLKAWHTWARQVKLMASCRLCNCNRRAL